MIVCICTVKVDVNHHHTLDGDNFTTGAQNNIKKTKEGMLNEDFGVNRTNPKKKLKAEQPLKNRLKCLLQLLRKRN
jgi:hypothetical protein